MESTAQSAQTSKAMLWSGRVLSTVVTLFMLFDGTMKVMKPRSVVEGTVQLGYPAGTIFPLGVVVLACTVLYAIRKTSVLGAILLTGFLGGATATMVRVQSPLFFAPVVVGILAWAGIFLRDERVRKLIPWRS